MINMKYKQRWFIFVLALLSLIGGFYWYILPLQVTINALKIQRKEYLLQIKENQINKKVNQLQQVIKLDKKIFISDQKKLLTKLFYLLNENNLLIQSMIIANDSEIPTHQVIQLQLNGRFVALAHFLLQLQGELRSVVIKQYFLNQRNHEQLSVQLELLMLTENEGWLLQNKMMPSSQFAVFNSPFCETAINSWAIFDTSTVPLKQMKMVGYLEQKELRKALILLPNGILFDISQSSILGKEHGVVIDVNSQKTIIEFGNKQRMELIL